MVLKTEWKHLPTVGKAALLGAGFAGAYVAARALQYRQILQQNGSLARGKRIVILGGGFAGAFAAQELARLLPLPEDADITLVDEHDYLLFTPMLTEAAAGEIDLRHIVHPLRALSPRVHFLRGKADHIDLEKRSVDIRLGNEHEAIPGGIHTTPFDHLVVAVGSVPNFHHLPGVAEHSIGMKRLGDAAVLLNRTLALLERASEEDSASARRALLTFVVGGGGFTGVETMAALNDMVRSVARRYPRIQPDEIRTLIIQPGDRLLPELKSESLARYAQQIMEERRVEIRLNTQIAGTDGYHIELKRGEQIAAHTLVWAGGVQPNPLVEGLPLPRGKHNGLIVDECCAVRDHPGLWALGDCAEVPETDSGRTYAPTAQNATREGMQVARNIAATLRGESPRPFQYTPIGEVALVGKRLGVAEVHGLQFHGLPAWAMWRMVYWAKMPDARQRIRILMDWGLDLVFGRIHTDLPSLKPRASLPVSAGTPDAEKVHS